MKSAFLSVGKLVTQDARLQRVMSGVQAWQTVEKKSPPKPATPPSDPNAGPVTTDGKSVTVRIPGLADRVSGKKKTDFDADWFAVSCANDKITATLVDETMELDALYAIDRGSENDLQLLGVSIKQKSILNVQINTQARAPNSVPHTRFLIWDVSSYVTNPVEELVVMKDKYDQRDEGKLHVYFLETGKTAGLHFVTNPFSRSGEIGRFSTTEQPAAPAAPPAPAPGAPPAAPTPAPAPATSAAAS